MASAGAKFPVGQWKMRVAPGPYIKPFSHPWARFWHPSTQRAPPSPRGHFLSLSCSTINTGICTARPHSSQDVTGLHGHGPWAGAEQAWPVGQHAQTVSHWAQGPGLSLIVVINWILPTGQSHRNATCTIRTSILFLYPGRLVITRNPYSSYLRHEDTT